MRSTKLGNIIFCISKSIINSQNMNRYMKLSFYFIVESFDNIRIQESMSCLLTNTPRSFERNHS